MAGSTMSNSALWNGTSGEYINNRGTVTEYSSLGALGFAARSLYGVTFDGQGNGVLATLSDATRVYDITTYDSTTTTTHTQNYVVINEDNKFVAATGALTIAPNTFSKSATDDIAQRNVVNVFYGTNNTCENVVLTDKMNFYSPVDIQGKQVTYARNFTKDMNTVCLPFAVSTDLAPEIKAVCTFDREGDDDLVFWFTKRENTTSTNPIDAYTPIVIIASEAFTLPVLTDVTIPRTTDRVIEAESDNSEDNSKAFGILKQVQTKDLVGESQADQNNVFGLSSDGTTFRPIKAGSNLAAFRMVISRDPSKVPARENAPRFVRIINEDGVDITDEMTGVQSVSTDAVSGVKVAGGNGEIVFTSDSNFGQVPVYSLDGKMVTVANVYEGVTTVNVAKGIYIVMGQKVMVK